MTAKKKPEDPHAKCPPAVWDGIQWVCNNHGQPEVIERTREAFVKGFPKFPAPGTAPTPRPLDTELRAEVAALGVKLVAAMDAIALLVADVDKLRATVADLPVTFPKPAKGKAG
jgi:hypothetical protein